MTPRNSNWKDYGTRQSEDDVNGFIYKQFYEQVSPKVATAAIRTTNGKRSDSTERARQALQLLQEVWGISHGLERRSPLLRSMG